MESLDSYVSSLWNVFPQSLICKARTKVLTTYESLPTPGLKLPVCQQTPSKLLKSAPMVPMRLPAGPQNVLGCSNCGSHSDSFAPRKGPPRRTKYFIWHAHRLSLWISRSIIIGKTILSNRGYHCAPPPPVGGGHMKANLFIDARWG
jgi:hypothetical protein